MTVKPMDKRLTAAVVATILVCCAASGTAAAADSADIIEVYLKYDQGNVTLTGIFVDSGSVPEYPETTGPYLVRVTADDGRTLYSRNFDIHTEIEEVHGGPNTSHDNDSELQVTEKRLRLPYSADAETVHIYRDQNEILSEPVPHESVAVQDSDTSRFQSFVSSLPLLPLAGVGIVIVVLAVIAYLSVVPEE